MESANELMISQNLSDSLIRRLFRYSKMTVMGSRNDRKHHCLIYVEFLEFLCRVADLSESRLEDSLYGLLKELYNHNADKILNFDAIVLQPKAVPD